jgi:hypothetical protein
MIKTILKKKSAGSSFISFACWNMTIGIAVNSVAKRSGSGRNDFLVPTVPICVVSADIPIRIASIERSPHS